MFDHERMSAVFFHFVLLLVHGQVTIIMVALCNRADHYIFAL